MINKDIIVAFSMLAKEKNIDRTNLSTIIEDIFMTLIHKKYGEKKLKHFKLNDWNKNNHIAVKEAVLPFNKFPKESIYLSPEMKSTGEVMGISDSMGESFKKASISAGSHIPNEGTIFISVNDADKSDLIPIAKDFIKLGFTIIATSGTANNLNKNGIKADSIFKVGEGRPNVVYGIKNGNINLVINTPMGAQARYDEESIGRACIQKGILPITTLSAAHAVLKAIHHNDESINIKSIQEYHN